MGIYGILTADARLVLLPPGAALVRRGLLREEKIMSCIHIHSKHLICFSGEKT